MQQLTVPGTRDRRLYKVIEWGSYDEHNVVTPGREEIAEIRDAHVVSSLSPSGTSHRPEAYV